MNFDAIRRLCEPVTRRVLHFYWRFSRGLTLGVRAVVIDGSGKVFLITHSYVPGWHLPGGGVEIGETALAALGRELREEGNIELVEPPTLFGLYFNRRISRRDHVALYVVRSFRQDAPPQPNYAIVAHGFFAPDALPPETTRATRERIAEVLGGTLRKLGRGFAANFGRPTLGRVTWSPERNCNLPAARTLSVNSTQLFWTGST